MDSNTIRWKIKWVYNWFEIKCMRIRGYVPIAFNHFTNKYIYELKSIIDKIEEEEDKPFEIYTYDKIISPSHVSYTRWWCDNDSRRYQERVRSRIKKVKSLSNGTCTDKPLFTRETK